MTAHTVTVTSKPELVDALRATWRKSAEHTAEQAWRFVRLTAIAAVPSLFNLLTGDKFDAKTLLAFIVPFAEVAWRQLHPALTASNVDSAPGATIVPSEALDDDTAPDGLVPDDAADPTPIGGDAAP